MIYLDYNASAPIAPQVREAMLPFLDAHYGNPSSGHWAAAPAAEAVAGARAELAALLGRPAGEVVFTSGGTEADNAALAGVFFAARGRPEHLITSAVEHPAVLEPCASSSNWRRRPATSAWTLQAWWTPTMCDAPCTAAPPRPSRWCR